MLVNVEMYNIMQVNGGQKCLSAAVIQKICFSYGMGSKKGNKYFPQYLLIYVNEGFPISFSFH